MATFNPSTGQYESGNLRQGSQTFAQMAARLRPTNEQFTRFFGAGTKINTITGESWEKFFKSIYPGFSRAMTQSAVIEKAFVDLYWDMKRSGAATVGDFTGIGATATSGGPVSKTLYSDNQQVATPTSVDASVRDVVNWIKSFTISAKCNEDGTITVTLNMPDFE